MKEYNVEIKQRGQFHLLYWNGRLIYKSKDQAKVNSRAKVYEGYAAKLNERRGNEE